MRAMTAVLSLAPALALGAAATFLPLRRARWIGLAVCAAGLGAAPWLAAALPSLSVPLVALSALRLFAPEVSARVGSAALAALVVAACVFYALALGVGPYDPYDLGFQARPLVAAVAALGVGLAVAGEGAALALLSGALMAYAAGLYANLWDALVDPVLVLVTVVTLVARAWRADRARKPRNFFPSQNF
jgi:hypothetical protein